MGCALEESFNPKDGVHKYAWLVNAAVPINPETLLQIRISGPALAIACGRTVITTVSVVLQLSKFLNAEINKVF